MTKNIKVWHLSSCTTCKRIIDELNLNSSNSTLIDIKQHNITQQELEEIQKTMKCSYEELFNKRAQKYKFLKDSLIEDEDFKAAILQEYTFLKRPIIQIGQEYFVGNSKGVVEAAKQKIG
ncbi:MAG: arsenate reductase family protein [Candidatus Nanoarchaeia archaeon]